MSNGRPGYRVTRLQGCARSAGNATLDSRIAPSLIFVVEDQTFLRMEAVDLLRDAGFQTIEAANADAALEIMRARWQEVRVLFTDIQMPGELDGVDLATKVHRCWPDVLRW